jgi:hypothetical protein
MIFSIPCKIELKNLYQILKECFGINEKKLDRTILMNEVIVKQPKSNTDAHETDFVIVDY